MRGRTGRGGRERGPAGDASGGDRAGRRALPDAGGRPGEGHRQRAVRVRAAGRQPGLPLPVGVDHRPGPDHPNRRLRMRGTARRPPGPDPPQCAADPNPDGCTPDHPSVARCVLPRRVHRRGRGRFAPDRAPGRGPGRGELPGAAGRPGLRARSPPSVRAPPGERLQERRRGAGRPGRRFAPRDVDPGAVQHADGVSFADRAAHRHRHLARGVQARPGRDPADSVRRQSGNGRARTDARARAGSAAAPDRGDLALRRWFVRHQGPGRTRIWCWSRWRPSWCPDGRSSTR